MDSDLRSLIMASRPSVVVSEARASLLNPSRPHTPLQTTRRRFDFEAAAYNRSTTRSAEGNSSSRSSLRQKLFKDARAEDIAEQQETKVEPTQEKRNHGSARLRNSYKARDVERRPQKPATEKDECESNSGRREDNCDDKTGNNKIRFSSTKKSVDNKRKKSPSTALLHGSDNEDDDVVGSARALLGENTAKEVLREVQEKLAHLGNSTQISEECMDIWPKLDQVCSFLDRSNWSLKDEVEILCRYGLGELKGAILRAQRENDVLSVVRLCRICIRLASCDRKGKSDMHLEEICEIVYSIASEKAYDDMIRTEKVIEVMALFLLPEDNCDERSVAFLSRRKVQRSLVFALGSLKFISQENAENQQALATNGVIKRLAVLITFLLEKFHGKLDLSSVKDGEDEEKHEAAVISQILIESTAILRCLMDDRRRIQQVFNAAVPEMICKVLSRFGAEQETAFNCVRILSRLSTSGKGRSVISVRPLLQAIKTHHKTHLGICIRACYILGNMTTSYNNHTNRQRVACEDMEGLHLLTKVFGYHAKAFVEPKPGTGTKKDKDREDLLIKIVRLIANLSIDDELGSNLISQKAIPMITQVLNKVTIDSEMEEHCHLSARQEELALNAISFITNLSFYETPAPDDGVLQRRETVEILLPYLFSGNQEAALESARAFGNFSRSQFMQKCMNEFRVDEAMVVLLDHTSRDIVLASCGVLTNLVSYKGTRKLFKSLGSISKFVAMLRRSGVADPELSTRSCMVLHNFYSLATSNDRLLCFDEEISSLLTRTLEELIDVAVELEDDQGGAYAIPLNDDGGDTGMDSMEVKESMSQFIDVAKSLLEEFSSSSSASSSSSLRQRRESKKK